MRQVFDTVWARNSLLGATSECGGGARERVGRICHLAYQTEPTMTYTFKLSRRLAVVRPLPILALALVAACDVDPLGSAGDRG